MLPYPHVLADLVVKVGGQYAPRVHFLSGKGPLIRLKQQSQEQRMMADFRHSESARCEAPHQRHLLLDWLWRCVRAEGPGMSLDGLDQFFLGVSSEDKSVPIEIPV